MTKTWMPARSHTLDFKVTIEESGMTRAGFFVPWPLAR